MKIALLTDSMDFGGSERSVQILANNLVEKNYDVAIFSLSNIWAYPLNENIKTHYIHSKNYSFLKKLALLPFTFYKMKRQIYSFNPEVVISFTAQTNIINAFLSRNKSFKTVNNERHYAEDYYGKKNIIAKPIIKWMHNKVDAVIVNDIAIEESLKKYYNVTKPIFVLNNLFDKINLPTFCNKAEESPNKFKYITVGRLTKEKNTKDLILAFSQLENEETELEIIGDGPLRAELESLVKQLKISNRVFFRGYQKNPFLFLYKANVFVFSSLNEGFPNVILEAMACELPIISYHFKSGINTILQGGENGMLIELGNVVALSRAMDEMRNNTKLRKYYIQKSRQTIERFSSKELYIGQFEENINLILKK